MFEALFHAHSLALPAHGIAVLLATVVVFALFIWDRWPIASVSFGILAVLPLGFALFPMTTPEGPVNPVRFLSGLGHPALISICCLMVLGHALTMTGALDPVARKLSTVIERRPLAGLGLLLLVPGLASGIFNDTPLVVLLIPLILAACARAKASAAHYLLPMNFAVLIGGMATTIGTSTNLIVVGLAADLGGLSINMFDFYGMVMTASLPALLYLWLLAPRLLRATPAQAPHLAEHVFDADFHVSPGGGLEGRKLMELFPLFAGRLIIRSIRRQGHTLARLPSLVLKAGDRVQVQGTAAQLKAVENEVGTRLHRADLRVEARRDENVPEAVESLLIAQMIVTAQSPLADKTLRDGHVAQQHGIIVVGIRQAQGNPDWQRGSLSSISLRTGDILLIQGTLEDLRAAQRAGLGLLLDERFSPPRRSKAPVALGVLLGVVALSAMKLLPIVFASLLGVLLLVVTRTLSWEEVTSAVSAKIVLLVSASLALGDAMQVTGVTASAAALFGGLSSLMPSWAVLVLLMGLAGLLTNFVSNNAAAAIGTPLALALAQQLGLPPMPFVLAVMFGCNLCYATPMGYQTNLLVMNAAGYRFADFVRAGVPLFIIMWAGLSFLLIRQYGL